MRRFQRIIEPIDDYLSSIGLYRKVTAKDGSCLFRAVAEQVFHTQSLHMKVREDCIKFMEDKQEVLSPFVEGPYDDHLLKLKNPKEWAGQVEISALSLMYKRDFHVYQDPGIGAFNVTQNGFRDKIVLCFSHGNHYDSVFSRKFQENAAICQAVIYDILYKDVFKLSKQVDEAVDILRCSNKKQRHDSHEIFRDGDGRDTEQYHGERDWRDFRGKYHEEKRRPPLPYRVAKALDPEIYRNVEFDAWNEARKEEQQQDFLFASGMQYIPGDKCQVFLDDPKKLYNAHIQDVQSSNGPVTVFIEDLGEKHTIPMRNLRPDEANPHRPWSPLDARNYKNLSSYYQKFANGLASEPEIYRMKAKGMRKAGPMNVNPNMVFSPRYSSPSPPHHNNQGYQDQQASQQYHLRPLMQQGKPCQRPASPYHGRGNGRPYHNLYPSNMSQEEYEEKRALEESLALYELQEQDVSSFPPGVSGHPNMNSTSPVNLWDKFRREGRKSTSPLQRMNSSSSGTLYEGQGDGQGGGQGEGQGEGMQAQFQDMNVNDNGRGDGYSMPNSGKNNYHPVQTRDNSGIPCHDTNNHSPPSPKWHSSTSTLSTSGSNTCPSTNTTPSPPAAVPVMPSYNAPVPIGIPLYPLVIPLTDNLTGPVNANAAASRDPNGYDLPLSDVSTLRYYYNLGIEYQHRLYLLQMHHWQQQQNHHPQPQQSHPDHTPVATQAQHVAPHHQVPVMMQTSSVGLQYSPEGALPSGSNGSEEEREECVHQRGGNPNGPSQPYFIESPPVNHHVPQPQPPPPLPSLLPPQAPVNTFFNPHANTIHTESGYVHVNYQPVPPQPPPLPPPPLVPPGTYPYPVQGQWQPAFPYGSPVKVPTVAYGQSPPVTFMTNTAPAMAPALYIPTSH